MLRGLGKIFVKDVQEQIQVHVFILSVVTDRAALECVALRLLERPVASSNSLGPLFSRCFPLMCFSV